MASFHTQFSWKSSITGLLSQGGSGREAENLRHNLEAEREAVMGFLFTVVDRVCSWPPAAGGSSTQPLRNPTIQIRFYNFRENLGFSRGREYYTFHQILRVSGNVG